MFSYIITVIIIYSIIAVMWFLVFFLLRNHKYILKVYKSKKLLETRTWDDNTAWCDEAELQYSYLLKSYLCFWRLNKSIRIQHRTITTEYV